MRVGFHGNKINEIKAFVPETMAFCLGTFSALLGFHAYVKSLNFRNL